MGKKLDLYRWASVLVVLESFTRVGQLSGSEIGVEWYSGKL